MKVICYNINLFALVTRSTHLRTMKYEFFILYRAFGKKVAYSSICV